MRGGSRRVLGGEGGGGGVGGAGEASPSEETCQTAVQTGVAEGQRVRTGGKNQIISSYYYFQCDICKYFEICLKIRRLNMRIISNIYVKAKCLGIIELNHDARALV